MIVLFTSNSKGGILQFSIIMKRTIKSLGEEVCLYCPIDSLVPLDESDIIRYTRPRTMNIRNGAIKNIANEIKERNPRVIMFMDNVITTSEVAINIDSHYHKIMFIHDATPHLTSSYKTKIRNAISKYILKKSLYVQKMIICLSESGKAKMSQLYPAFQSKIETFTLGPLVTSDEMRQPRELIEYQEYALFFGRIDKYKGLDILVEQYSSIIKEKRIPLVVAGNGNISDDLRHRMNELDIKVINRYIDDDEMNWLFANSRVVVLPYIEASQSGVIPIAYLYNKPVIVSNLPGLTENVVDGTTGVVFYTYEELGEAMEAFYIEDVDYKCAIEMYFHEKYDWKENTKRLLENLESN